MYEPNKTLGQNFLTDANVAQNMVNALSIVQGDDVIEVGPGLGVVTEVLEQYIRRMDFNLYAVEIDSRFTPKLETMYTYDQRIDIINDDILKFLPTFTTNAPIRVIGSLPFYITSPIIHTVIKMHKQPESVVIMIQKEVAQKICATAPDLSYLAAFVQTFYRTEYIEEVSRTKFVPAPEVDAAVILLSKIDSGIDLAKIEKYEGFLHRAFRNPRKMLNKSFTKDELTAIGISPSLRPEAVEVSKWVEFFNKTYAE